MKSSKGADRGDGVLIHRGNKDLRKLTCPKCRGVAIVARTSDGRQVTRCSRCGAEFVSKPM